MLKSGSFVAALVRMKRVVKMARSAARKPVNMAMPAAMTSKGVVASRHQENNAA
jgi:hypothetical protein